MKFLTDPTEEFTIPAATTAGSRFTFRCYQKEDLARSAIHDGAIIAWDPGLGKTMAIFSWPFLKGARRVLIVAPAALHDQIILEGLEKFRVEVTAIADQDAALDLMRRGIMPMPGHQSDPSERADAMPEFFITDYRWLGYNGGDEWPDGFSSDDAEEGKTTDVIRRRRMAVITRHFAMPASAIRQVEQSAIMADKGGKAHEILGIPTDATRSAVKAAYRNLARLTHPDLHPEDIKATARMQVLNNAIESMLKGDASAIVKGIDDEVTELKPGLEELMRNVGVTRIYSDRVRNIFPSGHESPPQDAANPQSGNHNPEFNTIKCVWEPTLSSLLTDCFDCVVCDEAVRLKSGTTYMAMGVLNLRSKFRLALTGTPIKNRLPDVFFLASWVCGFHKDATARWPYGNTTAAQASFANNHLVMEENLTKEAASAAAGIFKRYIKQTNRITNVNLLWKQLGPIIARRRKDQIGNDIVGKIVIPIRVKPGTDQQRVYKWHLENPPECKTPVASMGAQLQCLRQAALNPWTPSLNRPGCADSKSALPWSPKMLAILHLAADLMAKGEQLVIFSPFQQFSSSLKSLLAEAGVPSLLLDGRVKNTKRGEYAAQYKAGQYPVLIAGIEAMGEGHSFECASHLVMPSLSWAYDANRQAIERVHRLTSRKDVSIYVMITENSIDERLYTIFGEKGDASDLALDGRLFDEDKKEVSLADLIRSATLDFDAHATTISERELVTEWGTTLRKRLATAAKAFTMQRGTAVTPPAAKPAPVAKQSERSDRKPAAKPATPIQPSFFTDMPAPTPPNPKSSILNHQSPIEPQPTNIIQFPSFTPTRPKLDKAALKRRALALLD